MDRSQYKKVTNQSISEIEVDQNFDQIMTHLNSKNPESPIIFPSDTDIVLPKYSLEGIVTIGKDEHDRIGLEIPGLLSINNLEEKIESSTVLPTRGNLCLMDATADYLQVDTEDIALTFMKEVTVMSRGENPIEITVRLYEDSSKFVYCTQYAPEKREAPGILFIGSWDEKTSNFGTISSMPTWTKNTTFSCVNEFSHKSLTMVIASFSTSYTGNILLPKTVESLVLNNFAGICDCHDCKNVNFDLEMNFQNCTLGTLLLSEEQWKTIYTIVNNSFLLDGKIKVQLYTTPEKPISYLKLDTTASTGERTFYVDEQGLTYGYGPVEGENLLVYMGDFEGGTVMPVTKAPTWSSNMMFLCSDQEKVFSLGQIFGLVFSSSMTSTIVAPKTLRVLVPTIKNFSGILDIHLCTAETLLNSFTSVGLNGIEDSTNGTILVNETQWTTLQALIQGETGSETLGGKIKIQKYQEGEQ